MNRPTWLDTIPAPVGRRLSSADADDLRWYWGEYDSAVGIRAHDPSRAMAYAGEVYEAPISLEDEMVANVDRGRRIRSQLAKLTALHASALFAVYGAARQRHPVLDRLGDVALVVPMTVTARALADRARWPVSAWLTERLSRDDSEELSTSLRMSAETLLREASDAYRRAKA